MVAAAIARAEFTYVYQWDQQANEPADAYAAYATWHARRSHTDVVSAGFDQLQAMQWSSTYRWAERARAYDAACIEAQERASRAAVSTAKRRVWGAFSEAASLRAELVALELRKQLKVAQEAGDSPWLQVKELAALMRESTKEVKSLRQLDEDISALEEVTTAVADYSDLPEDKLLELEAIRDRVRLLTG